MRWLLPVMLFAGCAHPLASLTQRREVKTGVGQFELAWAPDELAEQERVARSLERATPALTKWGVLERPVSVYLMPSHQLLESAVRHFGYDWLRAWAQYDTVYFQSPSSWGGVAVGDAEVDELVLHELTHCLMYQLAATKESWLDKQIPLWFREGMATWTAKQGYRWPSLEDLTRFYEQHPGKDPIGSPDGLYQKSNDVVYAAAHHGFTFLIRRYGEESVHRLLAAMRAGQTFPEAFVAVIGISAEAFAADFRHYVVWRGFRGDGQPIHRAKPLESPK